jgi:hypothetical protein
LRFVIAESALRPEEALRACGGSTADSARFRNDDERDEAPSSAFG